MGPGGTAAEWMISLLNHFTFRDTGFEFIAIKNNFSLGKSTLNFFFQKKKSIFSQFLLKKKSLLTFRGGKNWLIGWIILFR